MSQFEDRTAASLEARGVIFESQPKPAFVYTLSKRYTADFRIGDLYIETKGWFRPEDRTKMKAVKKAYPDLDIRIVFQNANSRLNSKLPRSQTNAQWAERNGFPWAHKEIPSEWICEATSDEAA